MLEQWVIDKLNPLKGEKLIILADPQRMIRAGAQAVDGVAAAAQFIKTHSKDVGLPNDWQNNYDIAVLATMMGIPKEGPSAGISITTGIVSALTGRPVRNDIAMTGEITIMGKVLAIGGVLPKLQAAIDAGCAEVIMPKENERDVQMTPDYVRNKIRVRFVSSIEEVLAAALLNGP
jgi:ATP-dependent Lon protease